MLKLSQKAWNNVIIFAMLFMVYLFSISNELMVKNGESRLRFLLPEHSVVMRIEFADVIVERQGQSWITHGSDRYRMEQLQSMVHNWGQIVIQEQEPQVLQAPYIVTIQLAGEQKARVYQLENHELGLLFNHEGRTFFTDQAQLESLVPL